MKVKIQLKSEGKKNYKVVFEDEVTNTIQEIVNHYQGLDAIITITTKKEPVIDDKQMALSFEEIQRQNKLDIEDSKMEQNFYDQVEEREYIQTLTAGAK